MSPTNSWHIGGASVVFRNNVYPQMEITHPIGSAAHSIHVTLLDYSCENEVAVTDSTKLVNSSSIISSSVTSGQKAKYSVEFRDLGSSSVATGNTVKICTKIQLLDENGFSVSFRKQKFSFDMEVNVSLGFTSVNMNIAASDIDEFALGSIEFYGVTACQCQTDFTCSPATVEQVTKVGICIMTSSPLVQYKNFDLTVAGNGNTGFSYQPVIVGANGSEGLFGTTIEVSGQVTKINFPLVTGLFEDDASEIDVTGNGQIEFVPNSSKLEESLKVVLKLVSLDVANRKYEVQVILEPPMQSGCLSILLQKLKDLF